MVRKNETAKRAVFIMLGMVGEEPKHKKDNILMFGWRPWPLRLCSLDSKTTGCSNLYDCQVPSYDKKPSLKNA
jgi:hypothetical protein